MDFLYMNQQCSIFNNAVVHIDAFPNGFSILELPMDSALRRHAMVFLANTGSVKVTFDSFLCLGELDSSYSKQLVVCKGNNAVVFHIDGASGFLI
jgi:hypothetical protein